MRLSEGANATYGAVQVHHNNTWTPVCEDGWSNSLAHLVCSEMGLGDGKIVPRSGFTVNQSDTMIFATCPGSATTLSGCNLRPGPSLSCSSGFYASVFCSNTTIVQAGMSNTKSGKMGKHFPVREFYLKYWKSEGILPSFYFSLIF